MANYANLQTEIQSAIYDLLNSNISNVTVVDGLPNELMRGTGFPYIIVRTPNPQDNNITFSSTFVETTVPVEIEIWSQQESVVRSISDSVREVLLTNVATLEGEGAFNGRVQNSSINPFSISENKVAHRMNMVFTYMMTGSVTASSGGWIGDSSGGVTFNFGSNTVGFIDSSGNLKITGEVSVLQDLS